MVVRNTIERILRDPEDASGQTMREWKIEAERGHITIRLKHGDGFLMMRADDVDLFIKDLSSAQQMARGIEEPEEQT